MRRSYDNRQKAKGSVLSTMFYALASLFMDKGVNESKASARAYHRTFLGGGSPEYISRKNSYKPQIRAKQKRKNVQLHPAGARRVK